MPKLEHQTIIGQSGSGKTVFACSLIEGLLDGRNLVVLNHKNDETVNNLISPTKLPRRYNPKRHYNLVIPPNGDTYTEALLWDIYNHGNCLLYLDEGYMLNPRSTALNSLYTQGRTKNIAVITLSQRPTFISRFAITEAANVYCLGIKSLDDYKTLGTLTGHSPKTLQEQIANKQAYAALEINNGLTVIPPAKPTNLKLTNSFWRL